MSRTRWRRAPRPPPWPPRPKVLHPPLPPPRAPPPPPPQPLQQPLPPADHAVRGYPHVVQHHLGGVRSPDPVLAELLSHGQPRRPRRHDERRLPARFQLRIHRGDHDVHIRDAAIGRPGLDPVEHPLLATLVILSASPDRADV